MTPKNIRKKHRASKIISLIGFITSIGIYIYSISTVFPEGNIFAGSLLVVLGFAIQIFTGINLQNMSVIVVDKGNIEYINLAPISRNAYDASTDPSYLRVF